MVAYTLDENVHITSCPLNSITTTEIPTGYTTVKISTTQIEHHHQKLVLDLQIPISPNDQERKGGTSEPTTWLTDLNRVKEAISFTGVLDDDSSESSFTKKTNLINIFKMGGTFRIVWGYGSSQEKYDVNLSKSMIKVHPTPQVDSGTLSTSSFNVRTGYDVQVQLIVGTDKGG